MKCSNVYFLYRLLPYGTTGWTYIYYLGCMLYRLWFTVIYVACYVLVGLLDALR